MAQITITYPDAVEAVLQRAQAEHGAGVLTDLLVNWIKDRQRHQEEVDRLSFKTKYEALPSGKRKQVDDLLDGKA